MSALDAFFGGGAASADVDVTPYEERASPKPTTTSQAYSSEHAGGEGGALVFRMNGASVKPKPSIAMPGSPMTIKIPLVNNTGKRSRSEGLSEAGPVARNGNGSHHFTRASPNKKKAMDYTNGNGAAKSATRGGSPTKTRPLSKPEALPKVMLKRQRISTAVPSHNSSGRAEYGLSFWPVNRIKESLKKDPTVQSATFEAQHLLAHAAEKFCVGLCVDAFNLTAGSVPKDPDLQYDAAATVIATTHAYRFAREFVPPKTELSYVRNLVHVKLHGKPEPTEEPKIEPESATIPAEPAGGELPSA